MADVPGTLRGPTEDNGRTIVPILQGYLQEAQQARRGGMNPRDLKWQENLDLYWNRYDHSAKASWQAQENMPEVPAFVDRFAAALKEALVQGPSGFYTVTDPADSEGDVCDAIKRATDVWLSQCGYNANGTPLGFPAVFEEQVKMGALMGMCSVVNWKQDTKYGRVQIETVDPRKIWLDPTFRNLYRIRRIELDKHELRKMAKMKDGKGEPIFNIEAIDQMVSHIALEAEQEAQSLTGHGAAQTSTRQPITMDEYMATVVGSDGKVLAENALMVVGNEQFLIRGPEKNPFWHNRDFLTFTPLVLAPLSVYGRSYMEDFGSMARTFNNLTNLLLDSIMMSSMKAYVCVPGMLSDPGQLAGGITPNKLFQLEEGAPVADFLHALDLGNVKPESFQMWSNIKNELREAADINEVGMGQFAPKSRTSAAEINQTSESSSALIRSIAQTIEGRYLNLTLDNVWKTGLQHVRQDDPMISKAVGEDLWGALYARRKELVQMGTTFQAHGISTLIQKQKILRSLMMLMQFLSQSDVLLAEFMKKVDLGKFVKLLFNLSDVDMTKVTMTEREALLKQTVESFQQAAQQQLGPGGGPEGAGGAGQEMQQLVQGMGVGRQV